MAKTFDNYGPVGDFPVKGKIVLVTGGGSGIGFEFTKTCHKQGARIMIGDLRLTPEGQEWFDKQSSKEVAFKTCDVTSRKQLKDLISAAIESFGEVPDIYAPIAGVLDPSWSNFWDDTEEDDYKTIAINVNHPLKLTRMAMRALLSANKKGVICLVASAAAMRGNYMLPIYTATKHAIFGLAKSLAQSDPDEGIRVVCVLPSTVQSGLWEGRGDHIAEATRYTTRKLMTPDTIAKLMLKMVESKEYSGGTCVLKSAGEERVVEDGWDKQEGKYDPSPRPTPDNSYQRGIMLSERGKKWEA